MSNQTLALTPALYAYLAHQSLREPELLRTLREETARHPRHSMQIAPEEGQFLAFLVRLTGARRCLEIGVFTGYSSLAVALALPADGRLTALDVSEEYTAVARRYWRAAGVEDRIDLHLGQARDLLVDLVQSQAGTYDWVFIDADKISYRHYYEAALVLVRPGGLIAIDNVLWGGAVADPADVTEDTRAIRDLNAFLLGDERIDLSLVPIGDGVTLARRRGTPSG
jgi:predicted O-methyltransferase YrrM